MTNYSTYSRSKINALILAATTNIPQSSVTGLVDALSGISTSASLALSTATGANTSISTIYSRLGVANFFASLDGSGKIASSEMPTYVSTVASRSGAVVLSNTDISGLGTMSTENSSNVSITGGSVSALAFLSVINTATTGTNPTTVVFQNTAGNSGPIIQMQGGTNPCLFLSDTDGTLAIAKLQIAGSNGVLFGSQTNTDCSLLVNNTARVILDTNGGNRISSNTRIGDITAFATANEQLLVIPTANTTKVIVARSKSISQSGHLVEAQSSTGVTVAFIDPAGQINGYNLQASSSVQTDEITDYSGSGISFNSNTFFGSPAQFSDSAEFSVGAIFDDTTTFHQQMIMYNDDEGFESLIISEYGDVVINVGNFGGSIQINCFDSGVPVQEVSNSDFGATVYSLDTSGNAFFYGSVTAQGGTTISGNFSAVTATFTGNVTFGSTSHLIGGIGAQSALGVSSPILLNYTQGHNTTTSPHFGISLFTTFSAQGTGDVHTDLFVNNTGSRGVGTQLLFDFQNGSTSQAKLGVTGILTLNSTTGSLVCPTITLSGLFTGTTSSFNNSFVNALPQHVWAPTYTVNTGSGGPYNCYGLQLTPTYNLTGSSNATSNAYDIYVNRTETSMSGVGGNNMFLWFGVAGTSKASIDHAGNISAASFTGSIVIGTQVQTTHLVAPANITINIQDSIVVSGSSGVDGTSISASTWTNTAGSSSAVKITPTYNQASGTAANTDLLINRTETLVGSGNQFLILAKVNSTSMFSVTNKGRLTSSASFTAPDSGTVISPSFVYTASGTQNNYGLSITPTYNFTSPTTSTATYDLYINRTETNVSTSFGSLNYLMWAGVGGGALFTLDNAGSAIFSGTYLRANCRVELVANALYSVTYGSAYLEDDGTGFSWKMSLNLNLAGALKLNASSTPSNTAASSDMNIYTKGGKFIIQYNDAGTVRYRYMDCVGTSATWVQTTTAP